LPRAERRKGGRAVGYARASVRPCACALLLFSALPPYRLTAQELTLVRFTVAGSGAVDSVRRLGIDLVEIRPRSDRRVDLLAVVTPGDRTRLAGRGWVSADVPRSPAAAALDLQRAARGAAAYAVYRDFDDPLRGVAAYLRALPGTHANVRVDSIGASTLGRPILAVKIGSANDDPRHLNVIFMATYHAREWASTEMALRLVTYLADSLPAQPGGAALLAASDIWVIPVVNPDGYQYTFSTTRLWRKNRRGNADGSFGVDLNRNHGGRWGFDDAGSSPTASAETYRGPSAASEPEVQAIEAFHRAHPPVVSVSYHTYTGAILYPWSHANGIRTGDDALFRAFAGTDVAPAILDSVPGSINRYYHPGPGWQLYPTNGDYTTWAYQAFRTAAYTVELTSGCCVSGQYYGFEFPDSEPLLARMFQDNLPFALSLVGAAGGISGVTIAPGVAMPPQQIEAVWPELRALVDVPAPPGGAAVDVATDSSVVGFGLAQRDSLGGGRYFARVSLSNPLLGDVRAVRLPVDGLSAEVLLRDGAEWPTSPWRGFRRTSPGYASATAWSGFQDTLLSPPMDVSGRSNLTLYFWTRHAGSIFAQQSRGRVQVSADDGATWSEVADAVGAAPEWYPVQVPLGAAAGAASIRLRFIADQLDWQVDGIAVTASDAATGRLFRTPSVTRAPSVEVSANPVKTAPVTLRWPAGGGSAQIDIFSLTGTRIAGASLPVDPGRWVWDLTTVTGGEVANGAYGVVITLGDGTRLRRRLLVAR